jgi:PAS domain S-box-containing protein
MTLDWSKVASSAVEHSLQPMLVADANGLIRAVNKAFERVLGCSRRELIGRELDSVLQRFGGEEREQDYFRDVMSQRRRDHHCLVTSLHGGSRVLAIDAEPVGEGDSGGLLIAVHSVIAEPGHVATDVEMEIEQSEGRFGVVRRLTVMGRDYDADAFAGRRCHELLQQRSEPCEDCPAKNTLRDRSESIAVRAETSSTEPNAYLLISARDGPPDSLVVSERRMTERVLRHAFAALLAELARKAQLSDRECQVLDELVLGYTLDEIARHLRISPRTVKFHQTNLLAKLGVSSRSDLLRLLL